MEKIKILVAPGDRAGSGKFRCIDPHVNLQNNHSDKFFVDINYRVDFNDENYLKQYDIVFLHRSPQHQYKDAVTIIKRMQSLGIKVVVDTDDYWHLDPSHSMHQATVQQKLPQTLVECLKHADLVTVPTEILAKEVRNINKNVVVLANAVDPNEEQFKPKPTESEFIRFGWLGGSSHIKDMELLRDLSSKQKGLSDKMQFVLCGFDTRGTVRMVDPETGESKERPLQPQESTWFMYELFLTDNYRNLEGDKGYLTHLVSFKDDPSYDDSRKPYRRIWTQPITRYANGYNQFDVALAPLHDTKFNMYKSQLKIIEAGFHKKALIAQNYGPYTLDLIDGVNALLVDTKKNHKQWAKHAKRLIENPELVKELGENLYQLVNEKYNLNKVTNTRADYYELLMSNIKITSGKTAGVYETH